jgi:4'-phosphopantetheinyl transferase
MESFLSGLDSTERARAARFRETADQRRFVTGRALTRAAVSHVTGQPAGQVRIDRTCPTCGDQHGRPVLPDRPDLSISVSHSGHRVVVAIAADGQVGVDVEQVGATSLTGLADRVCAPGERSALAALPPDRRDWGLLTYWCRKESLLKATGDGLRLELNRIEVSAPADPPRLLSWADRPDVVAATQMFSLDPGDGHVAALTFIGELVPQIREGSAAALLGLDVANGAETHPPRSTHSDS